LGLVYPIDLLWVFYNFHVVGNGISEADNTMTGPPKIYENMPYQFNTTDLKRWVFETPQCMSTFTGREFFQRCIGIMGHQGGPPLVEFLGLPPK